MKVTNLEKICLQHRIEIIKIIKKIGKGHIGGAFSALDIIAVLFYCNFLKPSKSEIYTKERSRFILSKGHASIALYVVLERLGLISHDDLYKMNLGGILGEHPDHNIPGIDVDTGSLGHGLAIGAGFAYSSKLRKNNHRCYVMLGDGECNEGAVWEAAMLAGNLALRNLTAIVDRNHLCIHGRVEDINGLDPIEKKWAAFGWHVQTVEGHDYDALKRCFLEPHENKPTVVIANTIKGKGVSFMENDASWHHGGINDAQFNSALKQLVESVDGEELND